MLLTNKYVKALCCALLLISLNEVILIKKVAMQLHNNELLQINKKKERISNSTAKSLGHETETVSDNGWIPESLVKLTLPNKYLYSPDYKLTKEYMEDFTTLANVLIDKYKYDLKVFIVSKISDKFTITESHKKNIEKFTNTIANLLYKDLATDSYSITIVISIEDRSIRIRKGANISPNLTKSDITYVIDQMLVEFRKNNYENALLVGVNLIIKIVSGDLSSRGTQTSSSRSWHDIIIIALCELLLNYWLETLIVVICLVIFLILGLYLCKINSTSSDRARKEVTKTKTDDGGLERLKKIKTSLNRNLQPYEYLEKTCVLCIENFKGDVHSENTSFICTDELVLDCGHRFHKNCIKTWFETQKNCPTCREKLFEPYNDGKKLSNGLVNIQTHYYPTLALVHYRYYDFDLIWDTIPEFNIENENVYAYKDNNERGFEGENYNNSAGIGGGEGGDWNDNGGGNDCEVGGGSGDW